MVRPDARIGRACFRVVEQTEHGLNTAGTAIAIEPRTFLTCHHVIDDTQSRQISLEGESWHGPIGRIEWKSFWPKFDAALGRLPTDAPDLADWLTPFPVKPQEMRGPLTVAGYGPGRASLDSWEDEISGHDLLLGLLKLQNTVRKGASGGPVLDGDKHLVGIVVARAKDGAQKFTLPLISIKPLLETEGVRLVDPSESCHCSLTVEKLAEIRHGPMMNIGDVPTAVLSAFAEVLNNRREAREHVLRADKLVAEHNLENYKPRMIQVTIGDMPEFHSAYQFWQDVFSTACFRSRRLVAALLVAEGAPEPRMLVEEQAVALTSLSKKLMQCR